MGELERIRYRPISIRELLTEMKDTSELMIDLAYSAALFDSKELAEEVLELESYVDNLAYLLTMNAMLAARDAEDAETLLSVTMVANAADKISDAAADMTIIVLKGIGVHPLIRRAFQKVEEHLTRVKVEADSFFVDKTVGELKLAPAMGVDVIAIHRGRKWIIDPDDDEVIREGDILIARGAPGGIDEFEEAAGGEMEGSEGEGIMTISPEVSETLVKKLVELKNTSELMLDLNDSALLLNSKELAEEVERLEEYMDDLHTEFELLALSSGFSPKESKDFLGLIRLGVVTETIADAAAQIAEVVLRGLKPHPILQKVIEEADETVIRVEITENSTLTGKKLREAKIPERTGMWVMAIRRGGKWIRPKPDTVLQAGDVIIASGYAEGEEDLTQLAIGQKQ